MLLYPAIEAEYPAIIDLVNLAFRGTAPSASWTIEAFIAGQRLEESLLREDLAAKPEAHLLVYRDDFDGELLGTVWLDPAADGIWYLGLLTVRPDLQNKQLGRTLLAAAEDYARERHARRIEMTVVNVRDNPHRVVSTARLHLTAETRSFPYGDERFGRTLRDDLHFVVLEKDIGPESKA